MIDTLAHTAKTSELQEREDEHDENSLNSIYSIQYSVLYTHDFNGEYYSLNTCKNNLKQRILKDCILYVYRVSI